MKNVLNSRRPKDIGSTCGHRCELLGKYVFQSRKAWRHMGVLFCGQSWCVDVTCRMKSVLIHILHILHKAAMSRIAMAFFPTHIITHTLAEAFRHYDLRKYMELALYLCSDIVSWRHERYVRLTPPLWSSRDFSAWLSWPSVGSLFPTYSITHTTAKFLSHSDLRK